MNQDDFLKNNKWSLSDHLTLDKLFYISQHLYRHYRWNRDWDQARRLDSTPPDREDLYSKIANHLPSHFVPRAVVNRKQLFSFCRINHGTCSKQSIFYPTCVRIQT